MERMHLLQMLLALAGYRQSELADYPFSVTHRRLGLGALALGSATIGAVLLGIATSRIDPSHPWRFAFGALAGSLYFVMLLSFDALFIVGVSKPKAGAVAARIALSLMVTAFSSVTLDALIAGKRLNAEIDVRRLDADLAARAKHGEVHDLKGKQGRLAAAATATQTLEHRLNADPETAEFVAAQERFKSAELALQSTTNEVEPRLNEVRAQMARLQSQLENLDVADDRTALRGQLAELRARANSLAQRLRNGEGEVREAGTIVSRLRSTWRAEILSKLQEARAAQSLANGQLSSALRLAEEGAAASRGINDGAFEANVVEQTAAYWSLASRDRAYLVMGVVVWLCCIALELLAVLVKLQLKPDAADLARSHLDEVLEHQRHADLDFQEAAGHEMTIQMRTNQLRTEAAEAELAGLAKLHAQSASLIVKAWQTRQDHQHVAPEPRTQAQLDRQFDSLQAAMSAKLDALLLQLGSVGSSPMAASAVDPSSTHDEPAMVPL